MESYLMITQINDFTFCPRSIYFHDIYRNTVDDSTYHQTPQRVGQAAHATVDEGTYSTRKTIITGMMVYSQKHTLLGRIDILDTEQQILTERKHSVSAIYDGFRYQLYAQYFALAEMGYVVKKLRIHSNKDNRTYDIPLPTLPDTEQFERVLAEMKEFRLEDPFTPNPKKCAHCIYSALCDVCPLEENHDDVS